METCAHGEPPASALTLNCGLFINSFISFSIVAFAVPLLIRAINRLHPAPAATSSEPTTKECPYCAFQITLRCRRCPHCTARLGRDLTAL